LTFMQRASFVLGLAAALVAGCGSSGTQIPTDNPDADVDSGDAGDPSAVGTLGQACDKSGALACGGHAQKLQLICDGGVWKSLGVCPGAQICDTRLGPTAGSCQDPDPACVGKKPGESFCEGAVRRTCGPDLITSSKAACLSAELCNASSGATCAKCLEGRYRCTGAVLEKCKADRSDFEKVDTCATEALCVDASGKCLPPSCAVGEYRCDGDTLQTCRASRNDWDVVKVCPTGLCDPASKGCRECVPSTKDCAAGNTPRLCDSTGHWTSSTPCSVPTPLCKAGVCTPGACAAGDYRCTVDTLETCNSTYDGFDPVKICSPGLCDATGKECDDCKSGDKGCVSSTTPRACDSTGHWKSLTPCSGSTPTCSGGLCTSCAGGLTACSGTCVDLTTDPTNCGACGTTCSTGATCVAGACTTTVVLEDFDKSGWLYSPWVVVSGGTAGVPSASCKHDGGYGISDMGWIYRTDVTVGAAGEKLAAWGMPGISRLYLGFGASGSGCWSLVMAPNTNEFKFQQNIAYGYTELAAVSFTYTTGKWYRMEVTFTGTTSVTGRLYDSDGTTVLATVTTTLPGLSSGGVALRSLAMCVDTITR